MPNYIYRRRKDADVEGCGACADGFEVLQTLSEDPLETCPRCEAPIQRVIGATNFMANRRWDTKKMLSDGNLKKMGFKKLVKQSDGKYKDVLSDDK